MILFANGIKKYQKSLLQTNMVNTLVSPLTPITESLMEKKYDNIMHTILSIIYDVPT